MVFLVDHCRKRFVTGQNDAPRAFAFGVAAADQVAFGQQIPLDIRGVVDIDTPNLFAKINRQQGFFEAVMKLLLALDGQTRQEFIPCDIAGQPDSRGDNDVGNGVRAATCGPPLNHELG
jgi:hypothetical protein